MWEPALIVVGLALLVALAHFLVRFRRRRQALAELALRQNMRFTVRDTGHAADRLQGALLGGLGHSGRAVNLMRGRRQNRLALAFDYLCETGQGRRRATHVRSVVMVQHSQALPRIVGLPEDEAIAPPRGLYPVKITARELRQRFRVFSDAPDAAAELLAGAAGRQLLRCGRVTWETVDGLVLMYSAGLLSPHQLGCLLYRCCRMCDAIEGREPLCAGATDDVSDASAVAPEA